MSNNKKTEIMNYKELSQMIEILEKENKESNKELIEFYRRKKREIINQAFKKGLR